MKKFAWIISLALFCSCSSSVNEGEVIESTDDVKIMLRYEEGNFYAENEDQPTSRGKFEWSTGNVFSYFYSNGDALGIFPSTGYQIPFYVQLPAGDYKQEVSIDAGAWRTSPGYTYACYLPFVYENKDGKAVPFSYLGQKQMANNNLTHLASHTILGSNVTEYDEASHKFMFILRRMGCTLRFELTVPYAATFTRMEFSSAQANNFITKGYLNLFDTNQTSTPTQRANTLVLDLNNISITDPLSEKLILFLNMEPVDVTGNELTCKLYDTEGNTYTAKKEITRNYQRNTGYGITFGTGTATFTKKAYNPSQIGPWEEGSIEGGNAQ